MHKQNQISGVVLAGGLARRMQHQDKGLQYYQQQPLIHYALAAMSPLVDELMISANRNIEQYQQYGYPVIPDQNHDFDGPLAGILAALTHAHYPILLVMPCDSPFMTSVCLQRLLNARTSDTDITVAVDNQRIHPVFMSLKTILKPSLAAYLASGERKLQNWLFQHTVQKVDFSDVSNTLLNVNDLEQLAALNRVS